jgi:hypothetical protein
MPSLAFIEGPLVGLGIIKKNGDGGKNPSLQREPDEALLGLQNAT